MGKGDRGGGGRNQSSYLQVLGLGCDTHDTLPSVLLFFDNERYLFNIGEGFQKFSLEHRIKIAKIDGIFLTRTTTEAAGGLPGTLLTLADKLHGDYDKADAYAGPIGDAGSDKKSLSVYGPRGMNAFTNCLRTYVNIRDIKLGVKEIGDGAGGPEAGASATNFERHVLVKNDAVEISSVLIDCVDRDSGDLQAEKRPRVEGAPAAATTTSTQRDVDNQVTVSMYILDLCDIPGKFLPQKAIELGVQKGPAFGKLCRGESVMSSYGNFVQPEEVMEASTPGPTAVVLDLPTIDHLKRLEGMKILDHFAEQASSADKRLVVMHLTPKSLLTTPEYASFLAAWPPSTEHIVVNHENSEEQVIFASSERLRQEMHQALPEFFPIQRKTKTENNKESMDNGGGHGGTSVAPGVNLLKFHLRPLSKYGPDHSEAQAQAAAEQALAGEGSEGGEKVPRRKMTAHDVPRPPCVCQASANELEVTFCGTGAAIPSKYRNVSGIYCHFFERGGLLLDSGEGVCGQLIRRYGFAEFQKLLANLSIVWVSHIHADHHSGLPSLLRMRSKVSATPLVVVGPRQLRRVLSMYSRIEYVPIHFIDCAQTTEAKSAEGGVPEILSERLEDLGIATLRSVPVHHSCYHAFGVVLEGKRGWKLTFSGDTRPCDDLVMAAANSTIFIHEATFENGMMEEALAKKHSLCGEAIECGRRANAYRTILTHFSQRYPKIPVLDDTFTATTCVAFDLMTFNLSNLENLPKVTTEAAALYEDAEDEGRDPTAMAN